VLEFAAPLHARYGGGNSGDGGRAWDSAAWFMAIYGGHYGITMTPEALVVAPQPLRAIPRDTLRNLSYQGADIQLELDTAQGTYRIRSSRAIPAQLLPMGRANRVSVNGAAAQRSVILVLEPGREYEVRSLSSFGDGVQNSFTMR
jgi:hypothetical protein